MIFHEKIKRCLYLFDTYSDWNIWINLLDKIINENNKKISHDILKVRLIQMVFFF